VSGAGRKTSEGERSDGRPWQNTVDGSGARSERARNGNGRRAGITKITLSTIRGYFARLRCAHIRVKTYSANFRSLLKTHYFGSLVIITIIKTTSEFRNVSVTVSLTVTVNI